MRPRTWIGATALALALTAPAFTQEKPDAPAKADEAKKNDTTTRVPLNPFAGAKEGDWAAYTAEKKDAAGKVERTTGLYRIAAIRGAEVELAVGAVESVLTVGTKRIPIWGTETKQTFARGVEEAPTVNAFLGDDIQEVSAPVEEKVTIDRREFGCKRIDVRADGGTKKLSLWFSPDVKAWGLVKLTFAKNRRESTLTLTGMGTAKETLLGRKPAP